MKKHEENENGLLEHAHPRAPENPFNPDEHEVAPAPSVVADAASRSHHGVVREATPRKIGREEEAKLALEHTEISRATGWLLTLAFLCTIFVVPLVQSFLEVRDNLVAREKEQQSRQVAAAGVLPHAFDALQELPTREQFEKVSNWREMWALLPHADRLKLHETTLEEESFLANWLLPRMSGVLLPAGVGGEKVILGRRDASGRQWLFYKPDVDYLIGKGFLDPSIQSVRKRAGDASEASVQANPGLAIMDFQKQLATRNIELILMPVPVKPMLEAEHLIASNEIKFADLQNPSYSQFLQSLKKNGIPVFDPTPILRAKKAKNGQSQFLHSDTHWTPDAMQAVARSLAEYLNARIAFSGARREYSRRKQKLQNEGDITAMLSLPDNQRYFEKQEVNIAPVFEGHGRLWQSDKNAELLLLGDSFCNIYTQAGMGWGEGAGFAPQLSRFLKRPVDAVVVNAGGSFASRQRLIGEVQREAMRLQNKKVVVWEFSMRDLSVGDWKILPLPPDAKPKMPAKGK
jgi:alginate O-acetyltransferase complex protein AlgJ